MLIQSNRFLSNVASGTGVCVTAVGRRRLWAMLQLEGTDRNDALVDMLETLQHSS
jgi:hypothetical protein